MEMVFILPAHCSAESRDNVADIIVYFLLNYLAKEPKYKIYDFKTKETLSNQKDDKL